MAENNNSGKAVLILDMPNNCGMCKLKSRVHGIANVEFCCNLAEGMITLDKAFEGRLSNCPLRMMPEKEEVSPYDGHCMNQCCTQRERGFNDCINKILSNAGV